MFKKLVTIIGSTIMGTILFARVKEKEAIRAFTGKNDTYVRNEEDI